MTEEELQAYEEAGWRFSRDGSTATACLVWEDPEDPCEGWEILVLHTAGHGCRCTLNALGSGLTECAPEAAVRVAAALDGAGKLSLVWQGETREHEGE